MFYPFSSPRRTNASMECSVECFKHVYTPTDACFYWRYAQDDYSRRHKVCDGPELHCWQSPKEHCRTWSWCTRSKPGSRGAGFSTGVLLPTGLLSLPANCPSWGSATTAGVGTELAKGCRSCSVKARWQPALLSLGHRHSLRVFWSWDSDAGKALLKCLQGCLLWFQGRLQQVCESKHISRPCKLRCCSCQEEPWALSTRCGSKAEQGSLSVQSTALLPLPNGQLDCWRIPQTVYSCGLFL